MNRRNFLRTSILWISGCVSGLTLYPNSGVHATVRCHHFSNPQISLIIDDFGYNFSQVKRFLALNLPITYSVLPQLVRSRDISYCINESGNEVMLHQPMEPLNARLNPGPGALYVGYNKSQISDIINKNLDNIPFAMGINNHMGSKYTSSDKEMVVLLNTIKQKGLFFIDSLTSKRSVAFNTAKQLDIASACRNIFLDNDPKHDLITVQLKRLKYHAKKYGKAIAIGHPYTVTADAIRHFKHEFESSNISIVPVSKLLNPT